MKRIWIWILLPALAASCATLQPAVERKTAPPGAEPKAGPANDQDAGAEPLIRASRKAFQDNRPREAVESAQELLAKYPGSSHVPEAVYISAKSRYNLGELDLALKSGLVLVEKYPQSKEYPLARKLLGDCYLSTQDYLKAGQQYLEGLESAANPDDREALLLPLSALIEERLNDGQLRLLYRKYPQSGMAPALGLKLSQKELESGNQAEAVRLLQELVKKYPASPEAAQARPVLAALKDPKAPAPPVIDQGRKVGLIVPLSGRFGDYGTAVKEGVSLAFTEFNRTAGSKVKLIVEDSKSDIIDAATASARLADSSQVTGIIGEVLSVNTVAAAAVANAKEVPFLSPVASEDRISVLGPWVFQLSQNISWQGTAMADCAVKKLGMKVLGVVHPSDPAWAAVAEAFVRQARDMGARVLVAPPYEAGTTNFLAQAESLKAGRVQAVFIPAAPGDIVMIAPQLAYHQLKVQLLGTDGWGDQKVIAMGKSYVEGAIFPVLSSSSSLAQAARKFEESYKKAYGKAPAKQAAQAYDGARVMLAALQKGAATRQELQKLLAETEHSSEGASGFFAFGRQSVVPKSKLMTIRNRAVKELE
jgi:branched-chain amino acid transport system substrate-binding protein